MSSDRIADLVNLGMIEDRFNQLVEELCTHPDIADNEFLMEVTDVLNVALENLAERRLGES
jgi:hypothetical protein